VNAVTRLQVPQNIGKFLCGCTSGGFFSSAQLNTVGWSVSYVLTHCTHIRLTCHLWGALGELKYGGI
jgi:hypothetical protein